MDFMKLALTLCLQTTVNLLSLVTQLRLRCTATGEASLVNLSWHFSKLLKGGVEVLRANVLSGLVVACR